MKGSLGLKIIALICNKDFATCLAVSVSKIIVLMYEVFINHHSLLISNYQEKEANFSFHFDESFSWSQLYDFSNDKKSLKFCVYAENFEAIWSSFKLNYVFIMAAGGLVTNKSLFLMIHRNGKWDLPKGKLETGEKIDVCAKREVQEECGLNDLMIKNKLLNTYHTYEHNGQSILKETHWYLMTSSQISDLSPQVEEGIDKVLWVNEDDIEALLKNSYGNIKRVFESYKSLK